MTSPIEFPAIETLLAPLLATLPAAATCTKPPTAIFPLLSPILRQRLQILSESSGDPWLSLLCYDDSILPKLQSIATSPLLELHPVSGQVEIDWEPKSEIQFKRVDSETLNALITIRQIDLTVKLLWCKDDKNGIDGRDGWRIGEIGIYTIEDMNWGSRSITLAEKNFSSNDSQKLQSYNHMNGTKSSTKLNMQEEKEDDDDKYWAQYDDISTQSPAYNKDSSQDNQITETKDFGENEEEYYASYATVQPVLDGDNSVDAANSNLRKNGLSQYNAPDDTYAFNPSPSSLHRDRSEAWANGGFNHLAKTKQRVVSNVASEKAIKTHISASLKSLNRLASAAGIERREFNRIVRTQLDLMNTMSEENDEF